MENLNSMKFFYLPFLIFSLTVCDLHAQKKIKYKDLFPMLQTKDYVAAEPLLMQFLQENNDIL